MASALRDALASSGTDVTEKRTGTGRAFLVAGRALGQLDETALGVRVRLWLPEKERRAVERRPTFDTDSGWLHVVSDDDVAFVRGLLPVAYRAAATGEFGTAPTGRTEPAPAPATAGPKKVISAEKKESGTRRSPRARP